MSAPSAVRGLRQLIGGVLLIVAIGLPSCAAFNKTHAAEVTAEVSR